MINETKHTPGPWHVGEGKHNRHRSSILAGDDKDILITQLLSYNDEDQANARLIGAAPELLDACKRIISYITNIDEDDRTDFERVSLCCLQATIAKTEGR